MSQASGHSVFYTVKGEVVVVVYCLKLATPGLYSAFGRKASKAKVQGQLVLHNKTLSQQANTSKISNLGFLNKN